MLIHADPQKYRTVMEVYFISSSVFQSSHFNFYGAILKLKVKSEKMADYSTPLKRAKRSLSGAATYKSRFKKDWTKLYPVSEVQNSPGEFRCNVCSCVVSCSHQGEADVKRHVEGPIHQKKLKDLKSMKTLNNFGFKKQDDTLKEQVIHVFLQPRLYSLAYMALCVNVSHTHTHNTHTHTHTIIIMCE